MERCAGDDADYVDVDVFRKLADASQGPGVLSDIVIPEDKEYPVFPGGVIFHNDGEDSD